MSLKKAAEKHLPWPFAGLNSKRTTDPRLRSDWTLAPVLSSGQTLLLPCLLLSALCFLPSTFCSSQDAVSRAQEAVRQATTSQQRAARPCGAGRGLLRPGGREQS